MLTPSRGFSDSAGGIPRNCLKDALRPQKPYVLDRIWRNGAARWNAAPQGRIDSKRNPFLMLSHLGNAGNAGARPGAGRKRPLSLPSKHISDCKRRPAETDRAFAPFIRRRPKGDMYPDAMPTGYRQPCPRATVNRPNGSSSIVPTQQVDAHIRLAGIEGRRTPRAGGRRGCRRKRPGVQPGL